MAKRKEQKKEIKKKFQLPPVLEKTLRFKALKYGDDGSFSLWDTPCYLDPVQIAVMRLYFLKKEIGIDRAGAIIYHIAKLQSTTGGEILGYKFGYAETMQDKMNLLNFNKGQWELFGYGSFNNNLIDFKKNIFIFTSKSQFAKEYSLMFGLQDHIVDYFIAGGWAGVVGQILGKDCTCIETKCVVKGAQICEFVIKETSKWDKETIKANKLLFSDKYMKEARKYWRVHYEKN